MSATRSDITASTPLNPEVTTDPGFDFSPWEILPSPLPDRRSSGEEYSRILERTAALVLLFLLSPLLLVVSLAIKLSSPFGPVFYRQVRVGIDRRRQTGGNGEATPVAGDRRMTPAEGRPFMIWKFRTMTPDAEKETGPVWAAEDDPRITRIGRILRHLRLDELPQLINVICGSMRLIGPRPERPHFVRSLMTKMPGYCRRLAVPPGITGLAQVQKNYDASVDDVKTKLYYDLFYIENRCKLLDFKILLKTVNVVLRGRSAL